jgi:hypothetical protein
MLRRGVIVCMVILFAFQSVGYYVTFVAQVGWHKAWAREQVEEGDAETLAFLTFTHEAYENLVWAGELEFWHEGVLHDMKVATQAPDGSWRVMCMRDEHETRMLAEGKQMMANGESDPSEKGTASALLFGFPGILPTCLKLMVLASPDLVYGQGSTFFQTHLPSISSPPPQQV